MTIRVYHDHRLIGTFPDHFRVRNNPDGSIDLVEPQVGSDGEPIEVEHERYAHGQWTTAGGGLCGARTPSDDCHACHQPVEPCTDPDCHGCVARRATLPDHE